MDEALKESGHAGLCQLSFGRVEAEVLAASRRLCDLGAFCCRHLLPAIWAKARSSNIEDVAFASNSRVSPGNVSRLVGTDREPAMSLLG